MGKAMQAPRTTGPPAQHEDIRRPEPVVDQVRVELQPVVGTVSAPIFDEAGPLPDDQDGDRVGPVEIARPAVDLPWAALRGPSIRLTGVTVPLLIGTAVAILMSNPGYGAACGLFLWFAWSLGSASRRVPFSFGEGFVGYRPDPIWPQGVQEDDDVRWDWRDPRPSDDEMDDPDV